MKRKKVFDAIVLVIIIIQEVTSAVLEIIDKYKVADNILSCTIIISFIVFCISMYIEIHKYIDQIIQQLQFIQNGINIANTQTGKGSDDFYKSALEYMDFSDSSIWLTSLNDRALTSTGSSIRQEYLKSVFPFAKKHKNVEVRRIVRIPTLEKLKWVEEQIKETEHLDNVSIAYIEDDIRILNLQIFDEKRMLLWDPGRTIVSQQHDKFIFTENDSVVEMFSGYYENIWQDLRRNRGGFILKDGLNNSDINNKLQIIRNNIEAGK